MENKQKLELTWIGKENRVNLEPRILIEDPEKSYGDKNSENMLIHGDNLLALKALEQDYAGKIKCIYIDPPYNTGNAFEEYEDGVEHSLWLSLIRDRLEMLRNLLSDDGSIWISIDDDESHYLKVLCDEVFGRKNFVANIIWEKKHTRQNDAKWLSDNHDHILLFCKNKELWRPNLLKRTAEMDERFSNPDNDPRGIWTSQPLQVKTPSENCIYEIITPSGRKVMPPKGRSWQFKIERYEELVKENRIWFGQDGGNVPRIKKFLSEVKQGLVSTTLWRHEEVGHNQDAKTEVKNLFPELSFATPKPEKLIEKILTLASNEGDIVLDSFLGSGTTAAVAHKMGRKWIGIELGDHCYTHCLPRLQKVVDGEQGGISESVNWKGGGGFKFYELAPSLLKKDSLGQWIIDENYNADMLASAMAKHEGFKFNPNDKLYWKQGNSTEKDYIFTTTNYVTAEYLDRIAEEMEEGESLLICCKSFQDGTESRHSNITLKKIPQMLLGKCEFGKEDYSLNIINMPVEETEDVVETEIEEDAEITETKSQQKLF